MTSSEVVETSVNVTPNSASQDYTHVNDLKLPTYYNIISNFGKSGRFDETSPNEMSSRVLEKDKFGEMIDSIFPHFFST